MDDQTPIKQVLDKFEGSPSKLAAAIGGKVRRQHVEHWVKAGRIPADYCPDVEALTGIPCEVLRDDVKWKLIRGNPQGAAPAGQAA